MWDYSYSNINNRRFYICYWSKFYRTIRYGTNQDVNTFTKCSDTIDEIQGKIKAISCGGFYTALLTINGSVYCTGNNSYGQLGIGTNQDENLFTAIVHENINNNFLWISDGCTTDSVFAYKELICKINITQYCNNKSNKICCNKNTKICYNKNYKIKNIITQINDLIKY